WRAHLHEIVKQALDGAFGVADVAADLVKRTQWFRLVEVLREADLVADFRRVRFDPGIGNIRDHFACDKCVDPSGFKQRHLLEIAKFGIGLVLYNDGFSLEAGLEEAVQGISRGFPELVGLRYDRWGRFNPPTDRSKYLLQIAGRQADACVVERRG